MRRIRRIRSEELEGVCRNREVPSVPEGIATGRSRSRMKAPRRSVATLLLMAVALTGCRGKGSEEEEELASPEVPTITAEIGVVARGDLLEPLPVSGTVSAPPNEDVRLAALVPGRVTSLTVAEGDPVTQGQVVARIEAAPFAEKKSQAEAALGQATSGLENA